MARTRTSRASMQAWVERWGRSGLSAAGFCRRHRIPEQRLSYWRRAVLRARHAVRKPDAKRPGFAPVRVVDLGAGGGSLEVVLASGDRLVLREGVSVDLLRDALVVLRERC
jgi:2-polyprenyl-3-methyl-5-hydroxy-6-metoxy-1,4-benzoquinol methylase